MQKYALNKVRRLDLLNEVKQQFPEKKGAIVLFAHFEHEKHRFLQESSFYYLTGVTESAAVLVISLGGATTLYMPNCLEERKKWLPCPIMVSDECAKKLEVDCVKYLGARCPGYQAYPYFEPPMYEALLADLKIELGDDGTLFTLAPESPYAYAEQRGLLRRLQDLGLTKQVQDVSAIVARMRRSKDMDEIEALYKAVEITCLAQEAAAQAIGDGVAEAEVQASLEYMITGSRARIAFPSIVGSGANSTVLHYTENDGIMKEGDLVVVDIGAQYNHYCADLTRTYPVSGEFTARQKEVYNLVLETQEYIAQLAKPGMWLSNKDKPEQSLNHLAKKFLEQKGYADYFPHGIGHYLGLDVHDVGDYAEPLASGDVITIEPGIYIPEEQIGIRIEDNYWITKDGAICLSEQLPKDVTSIEQMVKKSFS